LLARWSCPTSRKCTSAHLQQLFACSTATERTIELLDAISHNLVSDLLSFVRTLAYLVDFVLILTDRARQFVDLGEKIPTKPPKAGFTWFYLVLSASD